MIVKLLKKRFSEAERSRAAKIFSLIFFFLYKLETIFCFREISS